MTESEAIKVCNTIIFASSLRNPQGTPLNITKKELAEAMGMAIQALEKQISKKPTYEGDGYAPDGTLVYDEWLCPHCDNRYEVDYDDYDFCPNCGQKIDWSVKDEQ